MEKANVYYTDFRTKLGEGLPTKLKRLIRAAGIGEIDMDNKFVAIKMHFGELGNLGFLRPNYAKAVADVVKELGGKPFLTDCNTLYVGRRKNALEHMDAAYENGFSPFSTGCQIIIGDGQNHPPVGGADADIVLISQPFQAHKTGKAARTVAALRHFTAISIENAIVKIQFRIIRRLNHQQLVKPYPQVPIRQATNQLR